MDINIHNSATTGTQDSTTTQINIEVNNLRNLEQNLITAENHIIQNENQIIQNENQIRGSDSAIAVTIEGMQLQSDNDNPQENEFENEVDSQQSRIIVEQALQSAHLCETKGFYIKYGGVPCCPSLTVTPTIMGSGLFSVSPTAWAIKGSSDMGCFCCFMPASWSWQTITLKQGEQEVLNFIYRPQIWNCFTTKEQIVDIYVPQRNERVGWIKYTGSLEDGAVMADCISKSVFLAKGIDSNGTPAIKVCTLKHKT
ncbi:unnamed protein product [Orchesella dallaii]|uniref:Uncharacterized protein n=1 Tax=Orchesella dallaii TaxID=48710 RepID=A0ABP1Q746_9HEXA